VVSLKEIKIAIVGCEESKWTNSQRVDAKEEIESIIFKHCHRDFERTHKQCSEEKMIIVSGHCPKGGVDIWAEEIADELGIKKEIYPAEVNQWNDKIKHKKTNNIWVSYKLKGFRSSYIQIAEACDVLYCLVPQIQPKHKLIDEIINERNAYCIHCDMAGHPTNGGCWTKKYTKGLGKETHLVVIE